ncbi:hypothetical protein GPALN_007496 [Globodera pallida]|nr:hypothetical protein GPALN_007496 [Globodera pallida]
MADLPFQYHPTNKPKSQKRGETLVLTIAVSTLGAYSRSQVSPVCRCFVGNAGVVVVAMDNKFDASTLGICLVILSTVIAAY